MVNARYRSLSTVNYRNAHTDEYAAYSYIYMCYLSTRAKYISCTNIIRTRFSSSRLLLPSPADFWAEAKVIILSFKTARCDANVTRCPRGLSWEAEPFRFDDLRIVLHGRTWHQPHLTYILLCCWRTDALRVFANRPAGPYRGYVWLSLSSFLPATTAGSDLIWPSVTDTKRYEIIEITDGIWRRLQQE